MKAWLRWCEATLYAATVRALYPINAGIAALLRRRVRPGSVLHVSGMVHVAFHTVRILREHGVNADYLAIGDSPWWSSADYTYRATRLPFLSVVKEMWWVWRIVSRYEIVHSHFMTGISRAGWEWALLRRMGRHIVVHYRGCEVRDRDRNRQLHPGLNICEECDYDPPLCVRNRERLAIAAAQGSAFLVTTPDLKDFAPSAIHVPFFVNSAAASIAKPPSRPRPFTVVHATNHPGIEGTRRIRAAIDSLREKGRDIKFVELRGVTHDRVLEALADADVSIGKMKMGYYANFQIESLAAGVPAITWVRPEFMTPELEASGLIFATLDSLEATIERLIEHPEELEAKRRVARESVTSLHDNEAVARQFMALYASLASGTLASRTAKGIA